MTRALVTSVYALLDPISGEVRYIGKAVNPAARFRVHLCNARHGKHTYCCRWIRTLLGVGQMPTVSVLGVFPTEEEAFENEIRLINFYRATGRLTNLTSGGEGPSGMVASAETRRKLSLAHTGKKLSPEHRAKLRLASSAWAARLRGTKLSDATREKIRIARAKQVMTPESRMRVAEKLRGKKRPAEVGRKISEAKKGVKFSDEHKRNIRAANAAKKGVPLTEEHRSKLSAFWKGRPRSPEHSAAISAALKGVEFSVAHKEKLKEAWVVRKAKRALQV